jgi:hypothetical protein
LVRAVIVAFVALLIAAPLARADGDPASDYLLTRQTFVPTDLGISKSDEQRLDTTVSLSRARGYPIRVAIVGSTYDLGSVGSLMNKPKEYARFLGQELRLVYHGPLLVVMPNGFGTSTNGKATPKDQAVVDRLPAPGKNGGDLVQGAIDGVHALAKSHGVTVPVVAATGGSSQNRSWLLGALALVAIVVAVGAGYVISRRRRSSA